MEQDHNVTQCQDYLLLGPELCLENLDIVPLVATSRQ